MSENSHLPTSIKTFVRMWHLKEGVWCHAWDVEDSTFRDWKEGKGPLSSKSVYLPNGKHPAIQTQVVCGTCGSSRVIPKEMRQEFMRR